MENSIEIQGLGKKYKLQNAPYLTVREALGQVLKRKPRPSFWALKDINMTIRQGDRVGIIGKNGAGKSTFLKLLSRITPPTTGRIDILGRVASLLEVGTGFHPELTGRENIYLNGSILGLKRHEITSRLNEIIEFSGVEGFIDSPLKHFSSGMQLRLAFSVAAHLEPEILLIDEVLAVGDLEFQKKCLAKMNEVSQKQGRTIVFVSHNMNYLAALCNTAVLLEEGKVTATGPVSEVIGTYVTSLSSLSGEKKWDLSERPGDDTVRLNGIRLITGEQHTTDAFPVNQSIGIEMEYEVLQAGTVLWLGFNIYNQQGLNVFDTHSVSSDYYETPHPAGLYKGTVWIPPHLLNPGNFLISGAIFNHLRQVIHFHVRDAILLRVFDVLDSVTARGKSPGEFPGVVRPLLPWTIKSVTHEA
ncbi:MAG TPA: ABC transporter ATP-binding protein [Flavisolibacter sp.]|jgi:lipopolysaccharide transport system ATP-binding protein|nr:ABC transporter ATP-binding protein [Flavisolibacter sp.]